MTILVTGVAGFIGFQLARKLLQKGQDVVGLDNVNDYYDVSLKEARLRELEEVQGFRFMRLDIAEGNEIDGLFAATKFDVVINLAAQAGVRYSIVNPHAYVRSNIEGFVNVLEACRRHEVRHLIYASSSSVYGAVKCLSRYTKMLIIPSAFMVRLRRRTSFWLTAIAICSACEAGAHFWSRSAIDLGYQLDPFCLHRRDRLVHASVGEHDAS